MSMNRSRTQSSDVTVHEYPTRALFQGTNGFGYKAASGGPKIVTANPAASAAARIGIRRGAVASAKPASGAFQSNSHPAPVPRRPVDMMRKVTMGSREGKRQVGDHHVTNQTMAERPYNAKAKPECTPERRSVASISNPSIGSIALPNESVSRIEKPQLRRSMDMYAKTAPLEGGTITKVESIRILPKAGVRGDSVKTLIKHVDPAAVSPAPQQPASTMATRAGSRRSGLRRQSSVGGILKGCVGREPMSMRRTFVSRPPPIDVGQGAPSAVVAVANPIVHIAPTHQNPVHAEPPYGHRKLSLNRYHRKKSLEATKAHLRRKIALKTAFDYQSGTGDQTKHLVYANVAAVANCRRVASPVCAKRHYGQSHTDIFGF